MNGPANLDKYFDLADADDVREGLLAYRRYNELMNEFARKYDTPLNRVVAAFAALSPNNDYFGNLRSLVSVLHAHKNGIPRTRVVISTYNHCAARAFKYLSGEEEFDAPDRGLKIRNFYHNIMNPDDTRWVTIDGHMSAAWRDLSLTMKEAIIRTPAEYEQIANACKLSAWRRFIKPNQYQATIWFARKRVLKIKYSAQINIFHARDDLWQINYDLNTIDPYPLLRYDRVEEPK